jgi:hypothetical protein
MPAALKLAADVDATTSPGVWPAENQTRLGRRSPRASGLRQRRRSAGVQVFGGLRPSTGIRAMKASRNPSPLREFVFDAEMRVLGSPAGAATPFLMLDEEPAAAVRRRRARPAYWLQLHLGFLCEERRRETRRVQTKWQIGRQPGDWIWSGLEDAVRFMGALAAGQGQPAVLSTWAPAWPSSEPALVDVGQPLARVLPQLAWSLELEGLPERAQRDEPGAAVTLWRLSPDRQMPDTDLRAWRCELP